jgi:uncharacterized protein
MVPDRSEALELMKEKVTDTNLQRHMLAVGAVMARLAEHFKESSHRWEITGLLHDIDLGETDDPAIHGKLGASWLQQMGLDEDLCDAIRAHAGHCEPATVLAKALISADQLTGLIIACALVKERKLSNVTPQTILKRFKEKRFAAGADRASIMKCEEFGMDLSGFVAIGLSAMQDIAADLQL